jgi:hypothetical protein
MDWWQIFFLADDLFVLGSRWDCFFNWPILASLLAAVGRLVAPGHWKWRPYPLEGFLPQLVRLGSAVVEGCQ